MIFLAIPSPIWGKHKDLIHKKRLTNAESEKTKLEGNKRYNTIKSKSHPLLFGYH